MQKWITLKVKRDYYNNYAVIHNKQLVVHNKGTGGTGIFEKFAHRCGLRGGCKYFLKPEGPGVNWDGITRG